MRTFSKTRSQSSLVGAGSNVVGSPLPNQQASFDSTFGGFRPITPLPQTTPRDQLFLSNLSSKTHEAMFVMDRPSTGCTTPNSKSLGGSSLLRSRLQSKSGISLRVETRAKPKLPEKVCKRITQLRQGEVIQDRYKLGTEIQNDGDGDMVVSARRLIDGEEVVMKVRQKCESMFGDQVWRAVMSHILHTQGNPHVIDIAEILENDTTFYTVMPRCDGPDLFDLISGNTRSIPENDCKRIIRQLLLGVGHLHKNGLVHCDIKLDNVMLEMDDTPTPGLPLTPSPKTVHIIDFDNCEMWTAGKPKMKTIGGTEGFIAPEALMGIVSPQSDLYSIGIILYMLITRTAPFLVFELEDCSAGSPSAMSMYNSMRRTILDWGEDPWPAFPLACDVCRKLLEFELRNRFKSADLVLAHQWFAGEDD